MFHKNKTSTRTIYILITFVFVTFGYFILSTSALVKADTLDSSQYQIEFSNINSGSNNQSSSSYDLGTTHGQTAAQEFNSSGYTVKAGFQYIHSIIPFTFSISNTSVDLGTLLPNTPATATTDLSVSFGSAGQYQVTAAEIGPLETLSGADSVPDTTCNGGGETCSESSADVWDSTTAHGFGYNMSGDDVPADFINSTYYRPFADIEAAESPEVVMSNTDVTDSSTATMTFKANVSSTQAAGSYQTVIRFVATPSF